LGVDYLLTDSKFTFPFDADCNGLVFCQQQAYFLVEDQDETHKNTLINEAT
jgi:hypothetical protein